MKRLAVFVEGQTEQTFVAKLLLEVAGAKRLHIEKRKAYGGHVQKRHMYLIEASRPSADQKYYALIVDCGADNRVASDIREQYSSLVARGYTDIVGIRDVYPEVSRQNIPKLRRGMQYAVKTTPVNPLFVLAVMEIEAWFIAEYTHFPRIDSSLTCQVISQRTGFDPATADSQSLAEPAADLDRIYSIAGLHYHKTRTDVQRTVNALDYGRCYLEMPQRIPDLQALVRLIDAFLS